ncbi:MAG: hypothetical protein ACREDK_08555 [Thermoplasmata archaeon]
MVDTVENPYAFAPGSSTPGAGVSAQEGVSELWAFFYLSLANTLIIAVAGIVAWWFVH